MSAPTVYGLGWIREGNAWAPFPFIGAKTRGWEPIERVRSALRIHAQLLAMKGQDSEVLVEQAAWRQEGGRWVWVAGPQVLGRTSTIVQLLGAEVAQRAAWARA